MMENEDKLLQQYFANNRKEVADNGFSHRVMRHLPCRKQRLSQAWSLFCSTLALVLFITLNGLQLVLGSLREIFTTAFQNEAVQLDPKSLLIVGVVLLIMACRKIVSLA